ncbi:MAG: hypothetical protein ACO3CR_06675 [Solirubrobacterales bacterium]
MGTLDEAIREHLELKRRQGAGEDEIQKAEAEAFGPGEDEVPGASITAPAGEGDQLDKVFSGEGATDEAPPTTVLKPESGGGEPAAEVEVAEVEETQVIDTSEAEALLAEATGTVEVEESAPAPPTPEPPAAPEPPPPAVEPEQAEAPPTPTPEPVELGDEADASDLLEAERANLTGHPTENYDVDAAIAEEEELDLLSEGRLSEELDQALGDPGAGLPEGLGAEPTPEPASEVVEEEVEVEEQVEEAPEPPVGDDAADEPPLDDPDASSPLEETPDFLEEAPASDELWFEQGEPKDFDFGD